LILSRCTIERIVDGLQRLKTFQRANKTTALLLGLLKGLLFW